MFADWPLDMCVISHSVVEFFRTVSNRKKSWIINVGKIYNKVLLMLPSIGCTGMSVQDCLLIHFLFDFTVAWGWNLNRFLLSLNLNKVSAAVHLSMVHECLLVFIFDKNRANFPAICLKNACICCFWAQNSKAGFYVRHDLKTCFHPTLFGSWATWPVMSARQNWTPLCKAPCRWNLK